MTELNGIEAKSEGQRYQHNAGIEMLQSIPLQSLGETAYVEKHRRFENKVSYIYSRQVNPTNLCIYSCKFCDFAAKNKSEHAYSLDEGAILDMVEDPELEEVHITGGIWPKWGMTRSINLIKAIRERRPTIWIKAFTAVEVFYFSNTESIPIEEVLLRMKSAGLQALAGGGAEVLSDRIHQELYPDKIRPDQWLEIHKQAHQVGLRTNATLLFGHIETDEEIVEHLLKVRKLQDETGGFDSFIPLAYQPGNTKLVNGMVGPVKCLRVIATSRLLLDNISHIKSYWPTLNIETASAALSFGADDVDGTLGRERIMQHAKTSSPESMSVQGLEVIIKDAGQIPVARSGSFQYLQ